MWSHTGDVLPAPDEREESWAPGREDPEENELLEPDVIDQEASSSALCAAPASGPARCRPSSLPSRHAPSPFRSTKLPRHRPDGVTQPPALVSEFTNHFLGAQRLCQLQRPQRLGQAATLVTHLAEHLLGTQLSRPQLSEGGGEAVSLALELLQIDRHSSSPADPENPAEQLDPNQADHELAHACLLRRTLGSPGDRSGPRYAGHDLRNNPA